MKILNVIPKKHLSTYYWTIGEQDRACCVSDYVVLVADDNNQVSVISALDTSNLTELYDAVLTGRNILDSGDFFKPYGSILTAEDFTEFVLCPDGGLLQNLISVLTSIKKTETKCSESLKNDITQIRNLINDIITK